jgi:hypothetical protein
MAAMALVVAEDLFARLKADGRCILERVPSGTNVFQLRLKKGDPADWRTNWSERCWTAYKLLTGSTGPGRVSNR